VLFGAKYTYDVNGDRLAAEVTQRPVSGGIANASRSVVNAYDGLGRLKGSELGALSY